MKKPCSVEGCERAMRARGLCDTHWAQWRRTVKSVQDAPIEPTPLSDRFWAKVYFPPCQDDCWTWTGPRNALGYGVFQTHKKNGVPQRVRAHRFAWEERRGPIPDGLVLDHLCRNTSCVNPAHLEPVTQCENNRRGVGWSGQHAQVETCPEGHPYDEANTYWWKTQRHCRACRRQRRRDAYTKLIVRSKADSPSVPARGH